MGVLNKPKPFKARWPKRVRRKPDRPHPRNRFASGVVDTLSTSSAAKPEVVVTTSTADPRITTVPMRTLPKRRTHVGFDREREAYQKAKGGLLRTAHGRYFVFVGDQSLGPFSSFREAMRAGYREFGFGPLYIKQALEKDEIVDLGQPS